MVEKEEHNLEEVLLVDLHEKTDSELRDILDQLYEEERRISYRRRMLHGRIDILKAELVQRLKKKREKGEALISAKDIDLLSEILSKGGIDFPKL